MILPRTKASMEIGKNKSSRRMAGKKLPTKSTNAQTWSRSVRPIESLNILEEKYRETNDPAILFQLKLVSESEMFKAKGERLEAERAELQSINNRLSTANEDLKNDLRERLGQMEILFQDLLNMGISPDRLAHVPLVLSRCRSATK